MTLHFSQAERDAVVLADHLFTTVVKLELYDDDTIQRALDIVVDSAIDLSVVDLIREMVRCVRGMK